MNVHVREAMVINKATGREVIDFDPIILTNPEKDVADVTEGLADLIDAMDEMMQDAGDTISLDLVWSDNRASVLVWCDGCNRTGLASTAPIDTERDDDGEVYISVMCPECAN